MLWPTDILSLETWILILILLGLSRYYIQRKWQFLAKINIPHDPPSISTLGNLKPFFSPKTMFTIENDSKKKYGPVWGCYAGLSPSIVIQDPDILRQVYIKEFPNFPIRQSFLLKVNGRVMNNGLMAITGEQWKRVRSAMTPTFSSAKLREMTGIMEYCVDNTIKLLKLKNENGDGTFDAKDVFSGLSLDVVLSAAFSAKLHQFDGSGIDPKMVEYAKKLFKVSFFSPVALLCWLVPYFEPLMAKLDVSIFPHDSLVYFEKLAASVIKQRSENPWGHNRVDLLHLMMESRISDEALRNGATKGMTEMEIIGNSMIMILAGYETTGTTMCFLAYNLSQHPDVQTELQQEIDDLYEAHGKFDYEAISRAKFLDMCVNETLRLHPAVLRNSRYSTSEVTINGLTIPKGIEVLIPIYALHHDPDYWEEPLEFKPERMRDMSQIDPMMFQPFGAGPRGCIGMRFALMEMKLAMCHLLHEFTFKPTHDTPKPPLELTFGMTVQPAVKFNLQAVPRERC